MSEIKEAQKTVGVIRRTPVGGQALIEGVMMRGRYNWAVAVRQPDGTIYTEEHDLASGRDKNSWMYKPVIRGCTAFVESLMLGYRALEISANHAYDFSEEEEKAATEFQATGRSTTGVDTGQGDTLPFEQGKEQEVIPAEESPKDDGNGDIPKGAMTIAMILGLVLGVAIFIVAPAILTNLIVGDYGKDTLLWNVVDGILRVVVFVLYIWAISHMEDIKRMFAYHGAEHKTIHCYEHGIDLTPENCDSYPRLHVRCGTAFLIMTMVIAILVYTLVPVSQLIIAMGVTNAIAKLALVILSRIILLPLIAGIAYEITVKWAGARPENPLVKVILWPGMQMQRLTTKQPDAGMLECAIVAMKIVLEREEREAREGNKPVAVALSPCEVASEKSSVA